MTAHEVAVNIAKRLDGQPRISLGGPLRDDTTMGAVARDDEVDVYALYGEAGEQQFRVTVEEVG
jgi:hypothetical protein